MFLIRTESFQKQLLSEISAIKNIQDKKNMFIKLNVTEITLSEANTVIPHWSAKVLHHDAD